MSYPTEGYPIQMPMEDNQNDIPIEDAVFRRFLRDITASVPPNSPGDILFEADYFQNQKPPPVTPIPQRLYCQGNPIPHGAASQRIMFAMEDRGYLPAELALAGQFDRLVDRNSAVFTDHHQTINMRIEWPGYDGWVAQIRVVDYRVVPQGISRAKLAEEISKQLKNFIEKMKSTVIDPDNAKYKVGPGGIELRHIRIAGLERVSRGSWQPCLFYAK